MAGQPDTKPRPRIKDRGLMTLMHYQGGTCVLADATCERQMSLHHIYRHPRDDVRANLIWLCGSGTTGHHGLITHNDPDALAALYAVLLRYRPDTLEYLSERLGGAEAATEWLTRTFLR